MFQYDHDAIFAISPEDNASLARQATEHWDWGLMRKRAEEARSREARQLFGKLGQFLGDLAQSRRQIR
ncbi:MAG: hypothetical protein QF578_22730 [Alphaproteobacteria bacterium]|jgi:hypothetical protein|nr:hypothetical protein [Alphaproteobacteria bacterium]MDP6567661.1 hypothetical protein [Alphaproteobacteria bacterium]MDP6813203.1 hypothetical protein [Alphaproteobacteria bacterium]